MYRLALFLSIGLAATCYGTALPQLSRDELASMVRSAFDVLRGGPGQIVTPQACNNYEVIIGRGTGEPGPFGILVGDPLMKKVKQLLPSASGYAVQYPADMSSTSESKGAADVAKRLKTQTAQCPNQKFALVGYSQGSRTVRYGLDNIAKEGGEVKKRVWDAVVAVVTYGDAGYRASENATRPSPPLPEEMRQKGIVVTNCAKGDPACDHNAPPTDRSGHLTYNSAGRTFHDQSAKFIVAAFKGEKLPAFNQNPMR